MADSVLVADVGNTSTAVGIYSGGRVRRRIHLATAAGAAAGCGTEIARRLGPARCHAAVLACVVPHALKAWQRCLRGVCGSPPLVVDHRVRLEMPVAYPRPETIGADRLADACGAVALYGMPVIIADFGTALTFDVCAAGRGYVGGVIAPGLPLMFDYLAERTALLPHIRPRRVPRAIARSTRQAMLAGARWGYLGMVREILRRLREELQAPGAPVCATGGYARWVLRDLDEDIPVLPDLTLYGLGRIHEINQKAAPAAQRKGTS